MTGLFFGSFNPIHNGHLEIANYLLGQHFCSQVWFVVSPQNPFKQDRNLLGESKRLEIVERAIEYDDRMKACDIEFTMPKPSYTIDTLEKISSLYPERDFALVIGGDNLCNFHLWKGYQSIAERYKVFVYPRPGIDTGYISYPNVVRVEAPLSDISSTEIRRKIKNNEDIGNFVPLSVLNVIVENYK